MEIVHTNSITDFSNIMIMKPIAITTISIIPSIKKMMGTTLKTMVKPSIITNVEIIITAGLMKPTKVLMK